MADKNADATGVKDSEAEDQENSKFEVLKTSLKSKNLTTWLPVILLAIALPITVVVALKQQSLRNFAGGFDSSLLTSVDVNPEQITVPVGTKSVGMSSLAYDVAQNPIYDESITYEWSVSSVATVGTLTKTNGNITEFVPKTEGWGEITAVARVGDKTVTKSIQIIVTDKNGVIPPQPTFTPTPTPTITNTPTSVPPTFTPTPTPPLTPKLVSFYASEDTYVRSDFPNKNYGKEIKLRIQGKPKIISYIKFNLASLKGKKITKATLRIKIADDSTASSVATQLLKNVGSNWNELSLTYKKRPNVGSVVNSFVGNSRSSYYDIDLTSWVKNHSGAKASLAIENSSTDLGIINSKESTTGKPTLIVTYQ